MTTDVNALAQSPTPEIENRKTNIENLTGGARNAGEMENGKWNMEKDRADGAGNTDVVEQGADTEIEDRKSKIENSGTEVCGEDAVEYSANAEMENGKWKMEKAPDADVRASIGNKRWGKVASLPLEVREWINTAIRDGMKYDDVLKGLAQRGVIGFTRHDLTKWRNRGGYEEWLRDALRAKLLRENTDKVMEVAASLGEDGRIGYEKVSAHIVAARVMDCLQKFEPEQLDGLLQRRPEMFFRLAKTVNDQSLDLTRLRKVELDFKKYKDHVDEQKAKMEAAAKPRHGKGLTKEQTAEIIEAMRML